VICTRRIERDTHRVSERGRDSGSGGKTVRRTAKVRDTTKVRDTPKVRDTSKVRGRDSERQTDSELFTLMA
jgi:hypothetical protein